MTAWTIDPIEDPRWATFVEGHPRSSVFHAKEWFQAIRRTYGYKPVVYTTSPSGSALANGVAMCGVRSWLTGKRLVSVPFADHCDLLVDQQSDLDAILSALEASVRTGTWKYVEIRPRNPAATAPAFHPCNVYLLHTIDISRPLDDIFARFHKDSNQRKIRRAEREGLVYEEGRTEAMLTEFYRLHLLTRRRHRLPPQPIDWFRNLLTAFGTRFTISTASKDGRAIGSVVTLRHRDSLVYKYGASDAASHNLGTMPFIFWRVIGDAKMAGVRELDLGRSNPEDDGLITFKERLGADRSIATYLKYARSGYATTVPTLIDRAKPLFAHLPDSLLVATGRLLYRHIG